MEAWKSDDLFIFKLVMVPTVLCIWSFVRQPPLKPSFPSYITLALPASRAVRHLSPFRSSNSLVQLPL